MGWKREKAGVEKADGWPGVYHQWIKRAKARRERRRAKNDPECKPGYGKYNGYES